MLPVTALLILCWWQIDRHLRCWIPDIGPFASTILGLSVTGSVFLTLYVIFLGTDGPIYEFLRRLGIYVFFGATGIAQLLTTWRLRVIVRRTSVRRSERLAWRLQLGIVSIMLLVGPLNLLLKAILDDARAVENIIEWNFGLVMFLWYGLQSRLLEKLPAGSLNADARD